MKLLVQRCSCCPWLSTGTHCGTDLGRRREPGIYTLHVTSRELDLCACVFLHSLLSIGETPLTRMLSHLPNNPLGASCR